MTVEKDKKDPQAGSLISIIERSESQGDITCDSLGDVTWGHGTHDARNLNLSGRSDGSRMNFIEISTEYGCRR